MRDGRQVRGAVALLLMLAALGGCASLAGTCSDPRCAQDADLTTRVREAVFADVALRPPNLVYVTVRNGVVYLNGMVDTDLQRDLAQSYARGVPGVRSVVNNIGVENNSR